MPIPLGEVSHSARIDYSGIDPELRELMQKHLFVTAGRFHDDDRSLPLTFERLVKRLRVFLRAIELTECFGIRSIHIQLLFRNIHSDETCVIVDSHRDPFLANSNLPLEQFMRRFGLVNERLAIMLSHDIKLSRALRSTRRLEASVSSDLL